MSHDKFILDADGKVVEEPDLERWGQWFETHSQERIVARTEIAPNELWLERATGIVGDYGVWRATRSKAGTL